MNLWVGYHPVLGVLVFDPDQQGGVPADRVFLWSARSGYAQLYWKEGARRGLMSLRTYLERNGPAALPKDLRSEATVVKGYFESLNSRRQSQPDEPSASADDWPDIGGEIEGYSEQARGEAEFLRELGEDADDWYRSSEEGWYYR